MRTFLKAFATLTIAAGAAWVLWQFVVIPYRCNNRLKKASDDLKVVLAAAGGDIRGMELARSIAADVHNCTIENPGDVAAQMVLAGAYRALGRNAQAIAAYQTALQYDRRPELYLDLGQTQLETGDSKAALSNLVVACIYNPQYLDEIGLYHPEVKRAVDAYQIRLMEARR